MSLTRAIALESPSKLTLSKSEKEELLAQAEEQRAFLLRRWSGSGFFN
jgi:predicted GIY-YIG superfamily endonuclease